MTLVQLTDYPGDVFEQLGPGPGGSIMLINRTAPLVKEIRALLDRVDTLSEQIKLLQADAKRQASRSSRRVEILR
jgi:hypothetical protein